MTPAEAALMAERFEWTKGSGIYTQLNSPTGDHIRSYTTEYYSQGFGRPMLEATYEHGAEPEYHLTDAGMARVLIEGKIDLCWYGDRNIWEAGYLSAEDDPMWDRPTMLEYEHESPHEAAAQAALAQIRGEHE